MYDWTKKNGSHFGKVMSMISDALIRKILQISEVLITVMACFSVIIFLSGLTTGIATGKPSFLGYRVMWVRTPSMEPAIMTGDFVLVKAVDYSDVSVGDVVVYRKADSNGKLTRYRIIHRIIDTTEEGNFIFKGDNNEYPDQEVSPNQIEYMAIYVLG